MSENEFHPVSGTRLVDDFGTIEYKNTPVTEDELKASAVAPRVTKEALLENIVHEFYFTAADGINAAHEGSPDEFVEPTQSMELLTFCVLELKNGFTVTGESACADPKNFNPVIGQRLARENAEKKIWPLMGYELRTQLMKDRLLVQDLMQKVEEGTIALEEARQILDQNS